MDSTRVTLALRVPAKRPVGPVYLSRCHSFVPHHETLAPTGGTLFEGHSYWGDITSGLRRGFSLSPVSPMANSVHYGIRVGRGKTVTDRSASIPLAVFDVDGVVLDCQSQSLLFDALEKQGLIREGTALSLSRNLADAQSQQHAEMALLSAISQLRDVEADLIHRIGTEVAGNLMKRYASTGALREIDRLRSQGAIPLLASAGLEVTVEPLQGQFKAFGQVATRLAVLQGKALGTTLNRPLIGRAKVEAVDRWARQRFANWHIKYAYTDSELLDYELLVEAEEGYLVTANGTGRGAWQVERWEARLT